MNNTPAPKKTPLFVPRALTVSLLALMGGSYVSAQIVVTEGTVDRTAPFTAESAVLGGVNTSGNFNNSRTAATLRVTGARGTSQFLNGVNLVRGRSQITTVGTGTSGTFTLNLGQITRDAGTTFTVSAGANTAINTTNTNTHDILGGWAVNSSRTGWLAADGSGNIVDYTGYTNIDFSAPGPYVLASDPASNVRLSGTTGFNDTSLTLTNGSNVIVVNNASLYSVGDSLSGSAAATNGTGTLSIPGVAIVTAVDTVNNTITISGNVTRSGTGATGTQSVGVSGTTSHSATIQLSPGLTDVNTIFLNNRANRTINIGAGNTLRLGQYGGVLVSPYEGGSLEWASSNYQYRLTFDGGSLTAGGADDTAGEIVFTSKGANNNNNRGDYAIVVNSNIVNNGSGAVRVIVEGHQGIQFNGTNTYSGGTYINQGRLLSSVAGNLGTGDVYVLGDTTNLDSGQAYLNGAGVYTNNFYIAGFGTNGTSSTLENGAIRFGQNVRISGNITLLGDSLITFHSTTTDLPATISGNITGNFGITFGMNTTNSTGVLILSGTGNDWKGETVLRTATGTGGSAFTTVLRLGTSNALPYGDGYGNFTLVGGVGTGAGASRVALELNGFNQTINGLNAQATDGQGSSKRIIRNSTAAANTSTFTVGSGNANGNFFGTIENGNVSAVLNFAKTGTGTQVLGGDNTYTGTTTINGGSLIINGTHIQATAGSGYTVNAGGTLGGTGRIARFGSTGDSVLVASGGILSPGDGGIGTLRLDGVNHSGSGKVLNMATGAQFSFDLAGNSADQIAFWNYVSGDLALSGNTVKLNLVGLVADGTYTVDLFTFFSNAGTTATSGVVSSGLVTTASDWATSITSATFDYSDPNKIRLTYTVDASMVPEPSTYAAIFGALALAGAALRRRSR